ncbi:MAG: copper oxidase [Gammaproteobacteria bacterium]|nr:copper oxidase [Gammaproteobacteria bacterium]MBK8991377.1 copper oxidase [Gammaproteobacteria bacterium]MBK9467130.1 copper oxidase [Gammaproteobacteria bacterium]
MISRRNILSRIGLGSLATLLATVAQRSRAQGAHEGHAMPAATASAQAGTAATASARPAASYTQVRTLNGWTLPYTLKDGVKEFHLVAEEVEHEFAPGCVAKCWGYNGSTPGPTLEAVEGDRVRIFVTNRLPEHTTIHWHGLYLPSGMDGVGGLNQPHIQPGETFVYEFTLRQHGTHMYHPHADEMVQLAVGMMGLFIIHPQEGEPTPIDRDYCFLLHNWALHPGTWRPDPSIMTEFDLWTFNSKVFPAIEPLVARTGERVRIRVGNLSMHEHPVHLHGVQFHVTGGDGGRLPQALWRTEVTELVGVGQMRDIEFVAIAGDWALHCHKSHHTMNAMGHGIANPLGVDQRGVEQDIRALLPGYMAMGEKGMGEHQDHTDSGHMQGPENTLPMMMGKGPFGNLEMGGMFTVLKVRDELAPGDFRDPGPYRNPPGTVARRVSNDPDFGRPVRRAAAR